MWVYISRAVVKMDSCAVKNNYTKLRENHTEKKHLLL